MHHKFKLPPLLICIIDMDLYGCFTDHLCYFCLVLCFHARLFINALRSPAGKGLTSWLSFVMSNCEFVTFPSVSWVRSGN